MLSKQPDGKTESKYITGVSKGASNNAIDDNAGNFEVSKQTANGSTSDVHNEIQYKCQPTDLISTCQPLHYSKRLLPVTALYSFPGSGNTWMRHLIQQITGIYTGAVYNDTILKKHGFPGEGQTDGHVIVVKTHRVYFLPRGKYKRAIIIIRNPFDAFLAEFKRLNGGHVSEITEGVFKEKNMGRRFNNFLLSRIDAWFKGTLSALKSFDTNSSSLIVHYENLKTNLRHELLRIGSFLGFSISEDILKCTVCNSEGNHHRNTSGFFNPFSKQDTFKISSYIKAVNATLKETCGDSCVFPYSTPTLTELL
ncbi:unnamed protein product [Owenia fusiformis]|uniref:Sulfotransferase domain-containing protein n=1 Tax=Owenia fusiformis TaxID=6347 RepID=A0A8J1UEP1_OWEFU|nr:unnamed protein product [Owenia fusiformis]